MIRFFEAVIKRRKAVIIVFVCLAAVCGFLMLGVGQNYDMSKYLPADSNSKQGIDILKAEYSYNGSAVLLLEDVSLVKAAETEERIEAISGIESVIWLDDLADLKQPTALIDEEVLNNYLVGDDALLQIVFEENDYADETHMAIDEIKLLLGDDAELSGSAIDAYVNVNSMSSDILANILIALAILIAILFFSTDSVFDVVLFLITIGIAIILNMGTNIIFGEISYMTFACAAVLQLAISMDYSIFLLHRFEHERKTEKDIARAMAKAARASFSSIISSGMTTIVGFIALVFMSYTMGADMGLVLAKGIVFSLLSVILLLPALTVVCVKAIDKTKHRRFLPSMKKVQHVLSGKVKYAVLSLLVILSVVCFLAQNSNTFLYSTSSVGDETQESINEKIESIFGDSNDFVILVPSDNAAAEYEMAQDLDALSYVKSVQGLYALVDAATPKEIMPDYLKDEFLSENYSRYIVEVDAAMESDEAMTAVEEIRDIVSEWFDEAYITGASPVIYDIQETTSGDFSRVTLLSIILVGLILLLTFKSLTIPVILLFIIETSIWINMSVPYFSGKPMMFIGYMIISAVQLGATIDYAILMTNYYLEGRKTLPKRAAGEYAADKAGASILISALVLSAAGFTVSATFSQEAMAQLGALIGRGALLSGTMTIIVLPQVLILFDKVIDKTTFKSKRRIRSVNDEI